MKSRISQKELYPDYFFGVLLDELLAELEKENAESIEYDFESDGYVLKSYGV